MNFVSKYIYKYDQQEYEDVSDEELQHGMDVSDSDSDEDDEECESRIGPRKDKKKGPAPPIPGAAAPAPGAASPPPAPPLLETTKTTPKKKSTFSRIIPNWKLSKGSKTVSDNAFEICHSRSSRALLKTAREDRAKRIRRADTNIVAIKFNKLIEPSNMHTGDVVYCTQCKSILSHISQLSQEDPDQVWTCEFCNNRNLVDIETEEKPKEEDTTYMLQPALSTTASGPSGTDESVVIFCIDTSGSMCVTTEVPGKLNIRGSRSLQRIQSLNTEHEDQRLPRQSRNVTYISRLQAMQAAVDHQLEDMMKNNPSRRVGLITFNNEVTFIGDGTLDPVTIAGDKLNNKEELLKFGEEAKLPGGVKQCRRKLGDKLFDFEEGGQTALGPALLIAVSIASQHPGSKVIVCTDGKANIGLGQLDSAGVASDIDPTSFYDDVTDVAKIKGVTVSVITLKGTDCKLAFLGKVSEETSGQVNIVDPLKLTEEFSTILADRIIATNVKAKMILHKGLYFKETDGSFIEKDIGNVSENSEITFEFFVRTQNKKDQDKHSDEGASSSTSHHINTDMSKELPFQLQIEYTDTEGARALRVITQSKPVTKDREKAERDIDMDLLGVHTAQTSAKMALAGEFTLSRQNCYGNQRLAWRNAHILSDVTEAPQQKAKYRNAFKKLQCQERRLNSAQERERTTRGRTYSDSEGDEDEEEMAGAGKKPVKAKKMRSRKADMSDEVYGEIYDNAFL